MSLYLITSGHRYLNSYGFPAVEIVDNYEEAKRVAESEFHEWASICEYDTMRTIAYFNRNENGGFIIWKEFRNYHPGLFAGDRNTERNRILIEKHNLDLATRDLCSASELPKNKPKRL